MAVAEGTFANKDCVRRTDSVIRKAEVSELPEALFAKTIQQGLKACLALWERTKGTEVVFVNSRETDVDILFDSEKNMLKVHCKWLDFAATHRTDQYRAVQSCLTAAFLCDHVTEELIRTITHVIFRLNIRDQDWLVHGISRRLQSMPRDVTVQAFQQGCLQVSTETLQYHGCMAV
jgi:hypothetical protein